MRNTRGRTLLGVGVLAIVGAFAYLMYSGIGDNLVYFLTPTELLAKGPTAYERPVRLGGQVVPGSVDWDKDALKLTFSITDGTKTLKVDSHGAPPTMFRAGMGVVVEGKFDRGGVFEAKNLMVKHSNEYHPPTAGHKPEEMYKTLIRNGES